MRSSIEKINVNPTEANKNAAKVDQFENEIDQDYIQNKSLLIKHSEQTNCGAITVLNDLFEFIEQAADMCADTADYIVTLAGKD